VKLAPQQAQVRDKTAQDRVTRQIREYDERHDPLLNPNAERHAALDRACETTAVQSPMPSFRKPVIGEIVIFHTTEGSKRFVVYQVGNRYVYVHRVGAPLGTDGKPTGVFMFEVDRLELTGLDSEGQQIKVPAKEIHVPDISQPRPPRPPVTKLRSRLIGTEVHQVEVKEYDEKYVRGPDGVTRPQREHDKLEFFPPLSLSDRWGVARKKNYRPAPSKRLFRDHDDDSAVRVPRIDVSKK
jgi:hypothetical protein